jgi:hypothetical protein
VLSAPAWLLIHATLFGVAGRQWLRQAILTPTDRVIIDGFLHLLEELEAE